MDKKERQKAHSDKQKKEAPKSKLGQKYVKSIEEAETTKELATSKNKMIKETEDDIFGIEDNPYINQLITKAYIKRKKELNTKNNKMAKKKTAKKKAPAKKKGGNAYFTAMNKAKKSGAKSFEYKGKTYVKKSKTGKNGTKLVYYKLKGFWD